MNTRLAFGVIFLFFIKCASDADDDRKTKVAACLNLIKAALHHDSDYFSTVAVTIDANDKSDLEKKFTSKALLNCYSAVSLVKSAELIHKKYENISPFKKENKEILDIARYQEKYKNDEAKLTKDTAMVENVLKSLEEEYASLVQMVKAAGNTYSGVWNRQQEERRRREKEEREEDEAYGDYENGRMNISFLTKMDPKIKYGLGIGLIAVIFLALYWNLRKLMKKDEKEKKKKKK